MKSMKYKTVRIRVIESGGSAYLIKYIFPGV
jgi:hypothetical protein